MKKLLIAVMGVACAAAFAGDGALVDIGGTNSAWEKWSDVSNWLGGSIAGDGGDLYITNSAHSYMTVDADANLGAIHIHSPVTGSPIFTFQSGRSGGILRKLTLNGGLIDFTGGCEFRLFNDVLVCPGDLTVNGIEGCNNMGPNNLCSVFLNNSQSIGGRIIVNDAVVGFAGTTKCSSDGYRADAIVLNAGGVFNQGGGLTIAANDGITLGEKGGYLTSGGINCHLTVNCPIVGVGPLMVEHQFSVVRLCNQANAWCGDTILGTIDRHANCSTRPAEVALMASEVIPHGPGKGRLIFKSNSAADNSKVNLTLNGVETVNAVESTRRDCVKIMGEGRLVLAGDDDSVLKAQIAGGVTVEKRGIGSLDFTDAAMGGAFVLADGSADVKPGCFAQDSSIDLAGGELNVTEGGNLDTAVSVGGAATLNDRSAAENPLVLRGALVSRSADGVLTINVVNGDKAVFEGTSGRPVVFDGKIVCNKSVEFRGNVWLKRPIEGNVTVPAGESASVTAGAMVTYDYSATSGDETIAASMRIVDNGRSGDTLTVGAGKVLELDTPAFENGAVSDPADAVRPFGVNVVLAGGTLRFNGNGIIDYTGTVSGVGAIEKVGGGSVRFANGGGLAAGTTIEVKEGTFAVRENGSVGGANILLNGGNVGGVAGEHLRGEFPVEVVKGGFSAEADGTFVYAGELTCESGEASVVGDGMVAFDCAAGSDEIVKMVVDGGTLCLVDDMKTGRLELRRGSVELNGVNLEIDELLMISSGGRRAVVRNSDEAESELRIVGDGTTSSFGDLEGNFRLVREGTGATYFYAHSGFGNTGITVNGGRVAVLPVDREMVAAQLLRWHVTKNRGKGLRAGENNWQVAEFYLMSDGRDVAWPEGTTVDSLYENGSVYNGGNTPGANVIDGNANTKVLFAHKYGLLFDFKGEFAIFDSYTYMTGDDSPGRDPTVWKLEAGVVEGGVTNWTTIANVADGSANVPPFTEAEMNQNGAARKIKAAEFRASMPNDGGEEFDGIAFPADYALEVNAPGSFDVGRFVGVLNGNLSGDGRLVFNEEVAGSVTNNAQWSGEMEFRKAVTDGADGEPTALEWNAGTACLTAEGNTYGGVTRVADEAVLDVGRRSIKTRYLRLSFQKTAANGGNNSVQLDEVDLYLDGARVSWPEGTVGSTAILPGSGGEKQVSRLMDDMRDGNHKYYSQSINNPITWAFQEPVEIDGYSLWTGNDCISGYTSGYSPSYARHPTSWTMEYSDDGITWNLLDQQIDNTTLVAKDGTTWTFNYGDYVKESKYFNAEFYKFRRDVAGGGVLSAASPVELDGAGAVMNVNTLHEEAKSLSGDGTVRLETGSVLAVGGDGTAFVGAIEGAGVFAKVGEGEQTLGGSVKCGEIVVEGGVLNLGGAVLNGVTNIVLRGGVLLGTAQCAGGLTVRAEGGAYGASIAVAGVLKLEKGEGAQLALYVGEGEVRSASFTFTQCDEASRAVYRDAVAGGEIPKGLSFGKRQFETSLGYSIARNGSVIVIR